MSSQQIEQVCVKIRHAGVVCLYTFTVIPDLYVVEIYHMRSLIYLSNEVELKYKKIIYI